MSWRDYMIEHGADEGRAWEGATDRIASLEATVQSLKANLSVAGECSRVADETIAKLHAEADMLPVKTRIAVMAELEDRYRWRPISEIHEDYGQCVLMNIDDPGYLEIGSNLDTHFDESEWTHFTQITPLSHEEAEALIAARDKLEKLK